MSISARHLFASKNTGKTDYRSHNRNVEEVGQIMSVPGNKTIPHFATTQKPYRLISIIFYFTVKLRLYLKIIKILNGFEVPSHIALESLMIIIK